MLANCEVASGSTPSAVDQLNKSCFCGGVDRDALIRELKDNAFTPDALEKLQEDRPGLFSAHPVFVNSSDVKKMTAIIGAVEHVVGVPAYRQHVLSDAPEIAHHKVKAQGVFFGYDFHLSADGPKLIEINTNAGGALLNSALIRAQRALCTPVQTMVPPLPQRRFSDQAFVDMFLCEWELASRNFPLRTVAIVDNNPVQQYLYPEFLLFQGLLEKYGISVVIADLKELEFKNGIIVCRGKRLDLVYNRLTDFYFDEPESTALRDAYFADAVVVTPHPRAHALYANKRNLAILSDPDSLRSLGIEAPWIDILATGIPKTETVTPCNANRLWKARRKLFFKPVSGFAGKAVYRGDKLTKRAWNDILAGDYVAQHFVSPSERHTHYGDANGPFKVDIRNYVYQGHVQLLAARMYQGQTTNFRTSGGGFASVVSIPQNQSKVTMP